MRTADSIGEAMAEIYSSIGRLIENEGTDWYLPDNVDQELIIRTMEEYYAFVNEAFLESDTYDEFENACLDHLQALCDETKTINDYFYLNACGNITFASYCAWVSIFSGYNTNAKGLLGDSREWLREKYQIVKGYVVEKIIKPIENIVSADLMGGGYWWYCWTSWRCWSCVCYRAAFCPPCRPCRRFCGRCRCRFSFFLERLF